MGVDDPCRVQYQKSGGVNGSSRLSDPVLNGLPAAEAFSGGKLARCSPAAHHLQRAPADPDPAHRVLDPAWTEPGLCHCKTGPFHSEQVLARNPAILED